MISADQYPVADVLGDKFIHEIPPYQRPYAWTPEQALQLIDDLREAMISGGDEPHFLGSIVLIRPRGGHVGQVVDGQQRLTTLTILAADLRDLATDPGAHEEIAGAVYINPNVYKKQVESVRVLPHTEDRIFIPRSDPISRGDIELRSSSSAQDRGPEVDVGKCSRVAQTRDLDDRGGARTTIKSFVRCVSDASAAGELRSRLSQLSC
jgi:hypothetical protein